MTADSPSQVVSGKRVMNIPVKHEVPMLSLMDVFSKEEVMGFVKNTLVDYPNAGFRVEEKIDGLSLSLTYEDGKLVQAATRGDGLVGEDVTPNVLALPTIPKDITSIPEDIIKGQTILRAECYMSYADFERVNAEQELVGGRIFANPRNCAAGTLRQSNPQLAKDRNLQVFVFNLQKGGEFLSEAGHNAAMAVLRGHKVPTVYGVFVAPQHDECLEPEAQTPEAICNEVWRWVEEIGKRRASLPYGIDGAVIKVDQPSIRERMGERTKNPKWAIAYKYPPEEKETTVKDIIFQTGRTGRITPVAVVAPVMLAGTTVERAVLHNQARLDELDIRVGDTVVMRKAGDIIPEVVSVAKEKRPADCGEPIVIKTCPVCGATAAKREDDGANFYCTNAVCPSKTLRRIVFFASRDCMDIRGLGPAVAEVLVNGGFIKTPADIYDLATKRDELLAGLFKGKQKSLDNLLAAIEKSKERPAANLLKGMGWENVGSHVSKALLKKYGSIQAIMAAEGLYEVLLKEDGFGDVLARSVSDMMSNPEIAFDLGRLASAGLTMNAETKAASDIWAGKTFVITGTLPSLGRKEAEAIIEANGGKVSGSVSKNTYCVLAGEAAGSKLDKANQLGIKVISEENLFAVINGEAAL